MILGEVRNHKLKRKYNHKVTCPQFCSFNLHCIMKPGEKLLEYILLLYDHNGTFHNLVLFLFEMIAEPEKVI